MTFPPDYYERVYAGVLGKIIGVYLGRPIEGWTYKRIMREIGEIEYYVNDRQDLALNNRDLVVTDDDITGTFTFLRALPDYDNSLELTPAQIGQTWLNYIIENRTILWWGGLGNSTEHTAFLRLKEGIPAPKSGSIELNGKVVAEQIGAQIFIDGWGLIAPGDPVLAVDLAGRAASVSHDGEAIYGAQVVAALIAQAFVETDIEILLDTAAAFIPKGSLISRLISDLRGWHASDSKDWHGARARLADKYGYDKYGGNCHIIPNHGLIILSLLYGEGDFNQSQTIVNTCGWDTDCNAGNVGCVLGVRNGLAAFENERDWRGPVADRLFLPTADGGSSITDAIRETDRIMEISHALRGKSYHHLKEGARFHFSSPGSTQGFRSQGNLTLRNVPHPGDSGRRVLALNYILKPGESDAAFSPTFIPLEPVDMPGYELLASPTLYPGQHIRAEVIADDGNQEVVSCSLAIQPYSNDERLDHEYGLIQVLKPGEKALLEWEVPDLKGMPVSQIGISLFSDMGVEGKVYLDYLTWDGNPKVDFYRPANPGVIWKRQWVDALDGFKDRPGESFRLIQNSGRGMAMTGTREWGDYRVKAELTPHMAKAFGLAARVQGLERYYALMLCDRITVKLVKCLDGENVMGRRSYTWEFGKPYELQLGVEGCRIQGWVDGVMIFSVEDFDRPLTGGGIGLVCEEGRVGSECVSVY